jgi:hypothetical protein
VMQCFSRGMDKATHLSGTRALSSGRSIIYSPNHTSLLILFSGVH